jgi:hypothetical protein
MNRSCSGSWGDGLADRSPIPVSRAFSFRTDKTAIKYMIDLGNGMDELQDQAALGATFGVITGLL